MANKDNEDKLSRVRDYTREGASEGRSDGGVILDRMVMENLSKEVTLKRRPKRSGGEKPGRIPGERAF